MEKDNKTNSDNIKTIDEDEILKNVMKEIEKAYGKGAIMKLGDKSNLTIEAISTGSLLLDEAIGIGGYPKGRIIEIFGPESSGKTTLSLHAIAETQKRGGRGAFIDAEHALDPNYARKLGVNIDELIIAQPDSGEQALDILETLVKSNAIDLVAALVPKVELDGEMSDVTIGAQARLMSKALRKLNGAINKTNSIVIFINQIREKVGVFFDNPETTAGGPPTVHTKTSWPTAWVLRLFKSLAFPVNSVMIMLLLLISSLISFWPSFPWAPSNKIFIIFLLRKYLNIFYYYKSKKSINKKVNIDTYL
ncbi:recombinase RecA [Spiroplasma endosymbiont of Glossina fuscipes fuscipes]|uniref:recombinase RecA n=1 Tax=Spiroplasma endosymbiont of Glossina fuscipes fuscipes TaxID=2004463 RepID=UPI003C77FA37